MLALKSTPAAHGVQSEFLQNDRQNSRNPTTKPIASHKAATANPNPAGKPKGDFDVLNTVKAVAGLLPRLIDHLEAQARDARVPVSETLFAELLARTSPGVTVSGMVERAIAAFLADPMFATNAPCSCHADAGTRSATVKRPDDVKLARVLFELSPLCRACRKVMSHAGRKEDRPAIHHADDGPQLLCGECLGWLSWSKADATTADDDASMAVSSPAPTPVEPDVLELDDDPERDLTRDEIGMLRKRLRQENPHCRYCGCRVSHRGATIDHVVPVSRGGRSCRANLVLACEACNLAKRNRTPEEWALELTAAVHALPSSGGNGDRPAVATEGGAA